MRAAATGAALTYDPVLSSEGPQTTIPAPERRHQSGGEIEVVIVDDRQLMRECMGNGLLILEPTLSVTYLSSADEFADLATNIPGRPRVVLVNITPLNGVEAVLSQVHTIKTIDPAANVIVLSETERASNIQQIIGCGASGYIPANIGLKVAMRAMQLVAAGGVYVPASVLASCGQTAQEEDSISKEAEPSKSTFTSKQLAVIEALRRGKANKIIAYELNMCESTVKVHVRNVMKKLRAKNRTEVAFILNENRNRGIEAH